MILVDSCVWIDFLRERDTPEARVLGDLVTRPRSAVCLSHIIYFEVLRGFPDELGRRRIRNVLKDFEFFDYRNDDFDDLIKVVLESRKKGFTLPKLGDWLILKTVLDHSLTLLTSDKHFHLLQRIVPFSLET